MRAIVLRVACNTCNSIVVHSQHPERARDTQNVFLTELEEEGWKLDNDSHQDMCPTCYLNGRDMEAGVDLLEEEEE